MFQKIIQPMVIFCKKVFIINRLEKKIFRQKISKTQKPIKAKIIIGKDTLKYLFKK